MCRQDEAGFPQKQLETAFLHSLRLLEQNREYLQMHLQPLKDARTAQALEDMEQEAARLERTFRELMELSAPEEPVQKRPVDLCRLLAQLEGLRGEIDAQSSTKLTVDCGGLEQCLVWGDREMAEQICFHLLSNALRYTPPGEAIVVRCQTVDHQVQVSVENLGTPIAPEHLPRLFDRFYRVDPSRQRKGEGSGIGLAIVKSIVVAHKGTVAVTSDARGTRFVITLPA